MKCPVCDGGRVSTRVIVDHKFKYGVGPRAVELKATIPVRTCLDCDQDYTDYETEDLLQEAIDQHLFTISETKRREM